MSSYIWREYPIKNESHLDRYYAKNFSLAWINWEMNKQEERLQLQKVRVKKS